jgi:hypothetical protein
VKAVISRAVTCEAAVEVVFLARTWPRRKRRRRVEKL